VPTLIIIAGPNGAGKTTFAREYLSAEDRQFKFVNADEIARTREGGDAQAVSDIEAARTMLSRIDELVKAGADFVLETTLANLTYAQKIPAWRKRGYLVSLVYWIRSRSRSPGSASELQPGAMAFQRIRSAADFQGA
jgi:predicted ABC-type ATPase